MNHSFTVLFFLCWLTPIIIYEAYAAHVPDETSISSLKPVQISYRYDYFDDDDNDYDVDDDDDDDGDDDDDNVDDDDDDDQRATYGYCISLPQNTPYWCLQSRLKMLKKNSDTYYLSTPQKPEYDPTNIRNSSVSHLFIFPLLDLSIPKILHLSSKDPKERRLSKVYVKMVQRNKKLIEQTNVQAGEIFDTFCDYAKLLEYYRQKQHTGSYCDRYFKFPSKEEHFKDIITSDDWQDDKVFVEQRLAGMNPMSLRKLSADEFTNSPKRFSPDLDGAIKRVLNNDKTTLFQMIQQGSIFIADYPMIHNLTNIPDHLDQSPNDKREMRPSQSPTAVFVSVKNCFTEKYELKPVAVQMDIKPDSDVILPTDGSRWLLAKQEVQLADLTHLEIIEHLLKTHLMMEPICVIIKRTLSIYHPLNVILKWHCRGTFVTNSIGLPNLVKPGGYMHKLLAIGDIGSIELLNKGYLNLTWDDTDFEENLKKRGVDDHEKLPYYPYRDDGIVIWKVVKDFAKEYVNLYYYHEHDVMKDQELQNFANELSADGVGFTGGKGMVKNFPSKIQTTEQLIEILARIIFIPVQHHIVAYPVEYYAGFVPNMPSKLYDDPRVPARGFSVYSLPESHVASIQVSLAMNLGSLRYDRLFDYCYKIGDRKAESLVYWYYKYLNRWITPMLRRRNSKRLKEGHLTYPYFLPSWIPNSIHA